jgi:hypothetical protein
MSVISDLELIEKLGANNGRLNETGEGYAKTKLQYMCS